MHRVLPHLVILLDILPQRDRRSHCYLRHHIIEYGEFTTSGSMLTISQSPRVRSWQPKRRESFDELLSRYLYMSYLTAENLGEKCRCIVMRQKLGSNDDVVPIRRLFGFECVVSDGGNIFG